MPSTQTYLNTVIKDYPLRFSGAFLFAACKIATSIVLPIMITNGFDELAKYEQKKALHVDSDETLDNTLMYFCIYVGLLAVSQLFPRFQEQLLIKPGIKLGELLQADADEAFFNIPEHAVDQAQGETHEFTSMFSFIWQPGGVVQGLLPVMADLLSSCAELVAINGYMYHRLGIITLPTTVQSLAVSAATIPVAINLGNVIKLHIDQFFKGISHSIIFANGYTPNILFRQQKNEVTKFNRFIANDLAPTINKLIKNASNTLTLPVFVSSAALFAQLGWMYRDKTLDKFPLLIFYAFQVTPITSNLYRRIIDGITSLALYGIVVNYINKGVKPNAKIFNEEAPADIRFEHVTFTYKDKPQPAVKDFSLTIDAGKTVALTGPNGAGKSTLFKMLFGFVQPDIGCVKLAGQDLATLNADSYRSISGILPQKEAMLSGTFNNNINCDDTKVADEIVQEVMEQVGLYPTFKPNDNIGVGLGGTELSGGQRQAVMLARVFLAMRADKLKYLFFDEGLVGLDHYAEENVLTYLAQAIKKYNLTTVIITHDLPRLRQFIDVHEVIDVTRPVNQNYSAGSPRMFTQPAIIEHVVTIHDFENDSKEVFKLSP